MAIENILAELIAAVKENTAALMSARVEAVVIENQLSSKSMLLDKTDEQRAEEQSQVDKSDRAVEMPATPTKNPAAQEAAYEIAAEAAGVGAEPIEPQGDPEAIVDKASAAYAEMKDAVLAVARKDKAQAVFILAAFGLTKMTEAKNKDVAEITTKMRAALDA